MCICFSNSFYLILHFCHITRTWNHTLDYASKNELLVSEQEERAVTTLLATLVETINHERWQCMSKERDQIITSTNRLHGASEFEMRC